MKLAGQGQSSWPALMTALEGQSRVLFDVHHRPPGLLFDGCRLSCHRPHHLH